MTDAALAWLRRPARRPFFLWVHYYDPHAPYDAPGRGRPRRATPARWPPSTARSARLLAACPSGARAPVVAAVADHGESLGEHGERGHGLFLYGPACTSRCSSPGPGVPRGHAWSTCGRHAALAADALPPGRRGRRAALATCCPGSARQTAAAPVYSETWLPATAYGWSPLRAWSDGRWRYVDAPRPELYDLVADPGETRIARSRTPPEASRLRRDCGARARR